MATKSTILLVNDQTFVLTQWEQIFLRSGKFNVHLAANTNEVLQKLKLMKIDLVCTEQKMRKLEAKSFMEEISSFQPIYNLPFLILCDDESSARLSLRERPLTEYLQKPVRNQNLMIEKAGILLSSASH